MNLSSLAPPHVFCSVATSKEFGALAYRLNYEMGPRFAVRTVRGKKMRCLDDLYDEFAAAFQFPDYFGENWAAFDECLKDLDWLPASGYAVFISDGPELLRDEADRQFAILVRILTEVASEWTRAQAPKPFHVLIQSNLEEVEDLRQRSEPPLEAVPLADVKAG